MNASRAKCCSAGFTLAEMMVSVACGMFVLGAILAAAVSLQRSFNAVEGYSTAETDQLRVQDYVALDCRRSTSVVIDTGSWADPGHSGTYSWVSDPNGTLTLLVTVPNFYDANGNPQYPNFTAAGKIQYGSAGGSTTISYYLSGTNFMRQIGSTPTQCATNQTWLNCAKAIATNVGSFHISANDVGTNIGYSITFLPRFTNVNPSVAGTTVYSNTFMRNSDARQ